MTGTPTPTRPEVHAPGPWAFPEPSEHTVGDGIRLLVHDLPGQYVVAVRVVVPLTLAEEPREREGVASVTARLLDEGTATHTAEELAEELERAGVALGAGVSDSALSVDLDVPQRLLPRALELLREVLAEPVFPQEEVQRLVRSRLAEIEQERASAAHRAARELIATLWDAGERASRPTAGTAETVGAITRADVVRYHAERIGPQGATVVVAGDLTGLDVPALVEEHLGAWHAPEHTPPRTADAPSPAPDRVRVVIVDRPGAVQSEIAVACPAVDRSVQPSWAPYPVLSFLVGGSPSARIDAVLREDKGWTYGIRSAFRPRRRGGSFVVSGSVRADVTAPALAELARILTDVGAGWREEEVRSGVDYVAGTAPGRYATADAVADESASLALEGLPTSFTTANLEATRALTGEALTDAWHRVVDGRWTVVVVGDAAAIREPVEALGLGPVTLVER